MLSSIIAALAMTIIVFSSTVQSCTVLIIKEASVSKTNHHRGFVAKRFTLGQRSHHAHYKGVKEFTLDGHILMACGDIFTENAKGIRRSRAGAKKFVHSRRRRADRDYLKAQF